MRDAALEAYATALFGDEDEMLRTMRREAEGAGLPSIQVPLELGRLLAVFAARAESVLEIGTLFGYSTVLMARALPPKGHITSLEVVPKHAALARANVERAGLVGKVTIREGNALEILKSLDSQSFDLVFIDADKESYPAYLEASLGLVHADSIIVADNVWRGGAVLDPESDVAAGVARFNQRLATTDRLRSTFVSTRGGADAASISVVRSI